MCMCTSSCVFLGTHIPQCIFGSQRTTQALVFFDVAYPVLAVLSEYPWALPSLPPICPGTQEFLALYLAFMWL